jgi:alpha-tubulin suppressor-like RCC1 family protein
MPIHSPHTIHGVLLVDQIGAIDGITIGAVFSGASHSLAVSSTGAAFTWGKNNQGQCAHGNAQDQLVPLVVTALQHEVPSTVIEAFRSRY